MNNGLDDGLVIELDNDAWLEIYSEKFNKYIDSDGKIQYKYDMNIGRARLLGIEIIELEFDLNSILAFSSFKLNTDGISNRLTESEVDYLNIQSYSSIVETMEGAIWESRDKIPQNILDRYLSS